MQRMSARAAGGRNDIRIEHNAGHSLAPGTNHRSGSVQSARIPGGGEFILNLEKQGLDSTPSPLDGCGNSNSVCEASAKVRTMKAPPAYWRNALLANMKSKSTDYAPQKSDCFAASGGNGLRSRKQNLASIRDIERRASDIDFFYGADDARLSSDVPFVAHVASLLRASNHETSEEGDTGRSLGFGMFEKPRASRRPAYGQAHSKKGQMASSSRGEKMSDQLGRWQTLDDARKNEADEIIARIIPNNTKVRSGAGLEHAHIMHAWGSSRLSPGFGEAPDNLSPIVVDKLSRGAVLEDQCIPAKDKMECPISGSASPRHASSVKRNCSHTSPPIMNGTRRHQSKSVV